MGRLLLVQPGPGSPDVLPLEAWHALTRARAFAAPGDPLIERLGEMGYELTSLDEAGPERLEAAADAPRPGGILGRNLLSAHGHGDAAPGMRDLADRLIALAGEHEEVAFVLPSDDVTRAVLQQALTSGVEVEVVVGRQPTGHRLLELVRVMARLRGPGGCPWDAEQTHQTLAKHLLDETYEVLDAIENGSPSDLAEELGDLLLQVVFHARMAEDVRAFDVDDVAQGIVDKLVRRHPHVFSDTVVSGAREVVANWDAIKQDEKQRESAVDGIPAALPALAFAQKLQRRATGAGFAWRSIDDVLAKVREEAAELANAATPDEREAELGDLLFSLAALARELDVDAETALRRAARTFADRFRSVERAASESGRDLSSLSHDELIELWRTAKAR